MTGYLKEKKIVMFPEEFYLTMHLVTPTQAPSEKQAADTASTGLSFTSSKITSSHPVQKAQAMCLVEIWQPRQPRP